MNYSMNYDELRFRDRIEAGERLSAKLSTYANRQDVLVLGLPRGGVPVAFEVARALDVPLDIITVRKLGVPGEEELAMGAIASGGVRVLNRDIVRMLGLSDATIDAVSTKEQRELARRELLYRGERALPELRGRTLILVDDGMATGATMRAAIQAVRQRDPAHVVVAVPVAALPTCDDLRSEGSDVVCVRETDALYAIGLWYDKFSQTTDAEIRDLLDRAWHRRAPAHRRESELHQ